MKRKNLKELSKRFKREWIELEAEKIKVPIRLLPFIGGLFLVGIGRLLTKTFHKT